MRHYSLEERLDGWWVRARTWVELGPPGALVDILGPFATRVEAWVYVHEVQARQVAICAAELEKVA